MIGLTMEEGSKMNFPMARPQEEERRVVLKAWIERRCWKHTLQVMLWENLSGLINFGCGAERED
jgi:hypothetical protein